MFVCPATKPNIKYLLFVAGSRHRNLVLVSYSDTSRTEEQLNT